jgi:beta-lactamase regulating signal transducer with metallopeptidase domain
MNVLETLWRQPLMIPLGWTLLHFLWQGTIIGLLFAVVNSLIRRSSAGLRYVAAFAAMLLMLVSVIGTFLWLSAGSNEGLPGISPYRLAIAPNAAAGPITLVETPFAWGQWLNEHLAWLVTLWFAGVVISSLRTAGGWVFAQSLKRAARPAEAGWQRAFARLSSRFGLRQSIALCESELAKSPSVIGWMRPALLLPVSAIAGLPPEMMEAILAHELAHIRRHDYLLNLLQTAIETLLFYHPAVWWVGKKIRQERENCCDDLAVTACGDALVYARALAALEQSRCAEVQLAIAATGGPLLARIRRLVGNQKPIVNPAGTWLAGGLVVVALGVLWAARPMSLSSQTRSGLYAAAAAAASQAATPEPQATSLDDQPTPQAPGPSPSPAGESKDFIRDMASAGYQNLSVDELISFKIHGVTPEYVREMEKAGVTHPTPDQLVSMRIHDVDAGCINALKAAGYSGLTVDQLVSFKIHGVDPAKVAEMQKLWGKLSPDQLVSMQIHDVTPEYAAQIKSLGLGEAAFDQLVSMKIHGVTAEYAREMKALGVGKLSLDGLVSLKIHGAEAETVAAIQKLGFGPLDADQIVTLQIHDVTPEFLRGFKDLGFNKLTFDEAVSASIQGVTPEFVKNVSKHGFNNLSIEQIIKLKQYDIVPEN